MKRQRNWKLDRIPVILWHTTATCHQRRHWKLNQNSSHFKWEWRRCFSQPSRPILNASNCQSISGQWEEDVLYQRLFRLALWETSSFCSSSQLSTWFMEMWTISRLALQSFPDKLVPSAHVTVVCFLHWPIFAQADKLNLPFFLRKLFFFSLLFFHIWPALQLQEMWDWHQGMNFAEPFAPSFFSAY